LIFLRSNAQDLIDEYWERKKAEKKERKPVDMKAPVKGRRSSGKEAAPESQPKKRARKSYSAKAEHSDDDDDNLPKKKSRTKSAESSAKRKSTKPPSSVADTADDDMPIGDMKRFMTVPSWEHIVAHVDTVERTEDGGLDVYFRL
jgi:hypothetical protein